VENIYSYLTTFWHRICIHSAHNYTRHSIEIKHVFSDIAERVVDLTCSAACRWSIFST